MRHGIRILLAAPCGLLTAVVITGGPSGGAAPTPDKPEIRGLLSQAVQQTAAM